MKVVLATCSPGEAAMLLYPFISTAVRDVVIPIATVRDPQRTGGWFTFWRSDPSITATVPVIGFAVGTVSTDRFQKYMYFANEKAARLGARPMDISSWQSRDESDPDRMQHKYGGAIRCGEGLYFSFSGFSEHEDEMICAIVAYRLLLIDGLMIRKIAAVSDNKPITDYYPKHL